MSEAVRAAIAAKRAAAAADRRKAASQPDSTTADNAYLQPFGSPKKPTRTATSNELEGMEGLTIVQRSLDELLLKSCATGRLNISSRAPALQRMPEEVFALLDGDVPSWYEEQQDELAETTAWYEREDLRVLLAAGGELTGLDPRIAGFRGLVRLDLQRNLITTLPAQTFQLVNLTTLNLSRNALERVPECLLALDSLIELDLSLNKLTSLWTDEEVVEARDHRRSWDEENADEEGGVWAGLIARMGSPTKRPRPAPPTSSQKTQALRSLRIMKLASNKLSNAALGWPSKGKASPAGPAIAFRWPPNLVELDLSDNAIRGPLPLAAFGRLKQLEKLSLAGNGIGDEVFRSDTSYDAAPTPFGPQHFFPSLKAIDLQRCELDDLQLLEDVFGSSRTVFDKAEHAQPLHSQGQAVAAAPRDGMPHRALVRVSSMSAVSGRDQSRSDQDAAVQTLCLVLEGNPLREETFKRKHGRRGAETVAHVGSAVSHETAAPNASNKASDRASARQSTSQEKARGFENIHASSPAATLPAHQSAAATAGSMREPWELEADAGLLTEGGRRRARAEAARKERERMAASNNGTASPVKEADGRHVGQTSAASGGAPAATQSINNGEQRDMRRNESLGVEATMTAAGEAISASAGSTLANTKLTKRQSEALGRVPCKFFRSANGCSAGSSCPFAHVAPGEGPGNARTVCEFFLRGNCRFGHKCALAHIREGEPMSMDRKNKKAMQQGTRPMKGPSDRVDGAVFQPNTQYLPGMQHASQMRPEEISQYNEHPWDHSAQQATSNSNTFLTPSNGATSGVGIPIGIVHEGPRSSSQSAQSASLLISSPPTSNAFGSSPFGQSVFFSGSQDEPDTFASRWRRPIEGTSTQLSGQDHVGQGLRHHSFSNGRRPMGRVQEDGFEEHAEEILHDTEAIHIQGGQRRRNPWADRSEHVDMGAAEDEFFEEDFLPSSLSDLLTPAELERRRRSVAAAGNATEHHKLATAQSMPASANLMSLTPSSRQNASPWGTAGRKTSFGGVTGQTDEATAGIDSLRFTHQANPSLAAAAAAAAATTGGSAVHIPGQSLPRGLAAGLSRLHLGASGLPMDQGRSSSGMLGAVHGADLDRRSAHRGSWTSRFAEGDPASGMGLSGSPTRSGLSGASPSFGAIGSTRRPSSLAQGPDDQGLGPIAPSSILPHRPGGLSSRLSSSTSGDGFGGQSLSTSFTALPSPQQPSSYAAKLNGSGALPVGSPKTSTTSKASGIAMKQHPGIHRVGGGGNVAPPSPLAAPSGGQEEDVGGAQDEGEIGMFELE